MRRSQVDGQPSAYKSLREKSPSRERSNEPGSNANATQFATVSASLGENLTSVFTLEHGQTEFTGPEGAARVS